MWTGVKWEKKVTTHSTAYKNIKSFRRGNGKLFSKKNNLACVIQWILAHDTQICGSEHANFNKMKHKIQNGTRYDVIYEWVPHTQPKQSVLMGCNSVPPMKIVEHFLSRCSIRWAVLLAIKTLYGCDILKYNQSFQIYNKLNFIQSSRNNEK